MHHKASDLTHGSLSGSECSTGKRIIYMYELHWCSLLPDLILRDVDHDYHFHYHACKLHTIQGKLWSWDVTKTSACVHFPSHCNFQVNSSIIL